MPKLTIPATIVRIDPRDEARLKELHHRFGSARRRAYALKQRGVPEAEIERTLQEQIGINSRYAKDAYISIKDLPPHATFGGLELQRLREQEKISRGEYHKRRNSLIISRGDRTKKGNLNARIIKENGKIVLRINVPGAGRRWIYPEIFIPKKYLQRYGHLLDGEHPYTVMIKRRDDGRGHDVRIVVEVSEESEPEPRRVMVLDMNGAHRLRSCGARACAGMARINCHEVQHAPTNKTNNLLHAAANDPQHLPAQSEGRVRQARHGLPCLHVEIC